MNVLIVYIALVATAIFIHNIVTNRRIMDTFDVVLKNIDDAATAAGTRVDNLIASIKASGATLTAAQQAEADSIVAHLNALGADPTNPVPTPPSEG